MTKEENLGRLCTRKGTLAQTDGDSAGFTPFVNSKDDTMKR